MRKLHITHLLWNCCDQSQKCRWADESVLLYDWISGCALRRTSVTWCFLMHEPDCLSSISTTESRSGPYIMQWRRMKHDGMGIAIPILSLSPLSNCEGRWRSHYAKDRVLFHGACCSNLARKPAKILVFADVLTAGIMQMSVFHHVCNPASSSPVSRSNHTAFLHSIGLRFRSNVCCHHEAVHIWYVFHSSCVCPTFMTLFMHVVQICASAVIPLHLAVSLVKSVNFFSIFRILPVTPGPFPSTYSRCCIFANAKPSH